MEPRPDRTDGCAPCAPGHRHGTADHDHGSRPTHGHDHGTPVGSRRLGCALALALASEALHFFTPDTGPWRVTGMAVAALAIALAGTGVYRHGLASLARGRLDIESLMAVAVSGAFLIGQWPEAAMVMALYGLAETIEARAAERARHAVRALLALAPEQATVRTPDGRWVATALAAVPLGALVRLRPGERVPLDGTVTRGRGTVDQSPVTGESLPVHKQPADTVHAATINQTAELEFRVTARAGQTTLDRIVAAVEQAQAGRAPMQRFVDRFAAVYTPAVFAIAVLVALAGPPLFGWDWTEGVYKALVLLVIACPCALVIATPVTVVSGLAAAARRGILVKGGRILENARLLKAVALDKTGTLTEGRPRLVAFEAWGGADEGMARAWAASLAERSDHPVSRAIAAAIDVPRLAVKDLRSLPGRGVEGRVQERSLLLGSHRAVHERGLCDAALEAALQSHEDAGRTVALLATGDRVLAVLAVADTLRASSRQAVAELQALGIVTVVLSGDRQATAGAIAAQAGIAEARGDLLPQDKLAALSELRRRHGPTAMAGDGINDAPALAQADIGFAMGGIGTDIAKESADVVVMNDDLRRLPETVRLSRRTHAVLWQNIVLALGIKAVFLALALAGSATMWMAVFADMGASLLVIGNGLRLRRSGDAPGSDRARPPQ